MKHTTTSMVLSGLMLIAPLSLTASAFAQSGTDIQMPKRQIPSGTSVKVKLLRDINSQNAETGDHVKVVVADDDSSGLPSGTVLNGIITSVRQATPNTAGVLYVRFGTGNGSSSYNLATAEFSGKTKSSDKSSDTSIGAGIGALLGFSRKRKLGDALGGAALGGLGGYAVNASQKHGASDINIKSGTEVTIKTNRPLTLQTQIISDY
ncbi:MAG: hypothetical protein ACRYFS_08845 [Janthinobacterium lividum]